MSDCRRRGHLGCLDNGTESKHEDADLSDERSSEDKICPSAPLICVNLRKSASQINKVPPWWQRSRNLQFHERCLHSGLLHAGLRRYRQGQDFLAVLPRWRETRSLAKLGDRRRPCCAESCRIVMLRSERGRPCSSGLNLALLHWPCLARWPCGYHRPKNLTRRRT
jgi:hypothetical protein